MAGKQGQSKKHDVSLIKNKYFPESVLLFVPFCKRIIF